MVTASPRIGVRRSCLPAAMLLAVVACGGPTPVPDDTDGAHPPHGRAHPAAYEAFLHSELLTAGGDNEAAAEELRTAISADATVALLHLRLAALLSRVDGGAEEGLLACQKAEDLGTTPWEIAPLRADLLRADRRPDDAIGVFDALDPSDAPGEFFAAWVSFADQIGDRKARARAAETWVAHHDDEPASWQALAMSMDLADERRAAADAYGQAAELPGGDPRDAARQVEILSEIEAWDEAAAAADACSRRFREHWPCYVRLTQLTDRGRSAGSPLDDETRDALARLAAQVSGSRRTLPATAFELRRLTRPDVVREFIAVTAELRPHNPVTLTTLAWTANGIEDYALAVELMERILVLDDANFDALNYVGYTWAELGVNLEQAEVYIREALFLRGDDGNILDSLAWVLFRQERFEEALEVQLRAVELVEDNAILWDHLGDIRLELGDLEGAISAWERAMETVGERDEDVAETVPAKIEGVRQRLDAP